MFPIVQESAAHAPKLELSAGFRHSQTRNGLRGLSSEVYDHDIRPIADKMPGLPEAAAQVHFFVIQKEAFIEAADLFEKGPSND